MPMSMEESDSLPFLDGNPELIVVLERERDPSLSREALNAVLRPRWNSSLVPLFDEELEKDLRNNSPRDEDLARKRAHYHTIDGPNDILEKLAEELREQREVETVYVKPGIRLPDFSVLPGEGWNDKEMARQAYLGAASTGGIEATFAHTVQGGDGDRTHVVDLEWNWNFDHEDLKAVPPSHQILYGKEWNTTHHGTAVVGLLGANPSNGIGIVGICPGAKIDTAVFEENGHTCATITAVAAKLSAGDIMVIPFERPGPRYNFKSSKRRGGIPLEWWSCDRIAIETAVRKDIIVVSAAGNGSEHLGDTLYDTPGPGFPRDWFNPFARRAAVGTILVGAGAPPPGTHGVDWGPDRSRIVQSNYGRMVDAQGWGHEVTTLGYGNVIRPVPNPTIHQYYTMRFGLTSGASTMVAGALACVQGARRAAAKRLFNSFTARDALRATGSPQQWPAGQPQTDLIGTRPNLRELFALP